MENPKKTDIMRKLILSLAAVFCVLTVSAQTEKWSVGGRVGSGLEAVGQYHLGTVAGKPFYIEGRFGMSWTDRMTRTINDPFWGSYRVTGKANAAGLTANFTVLAAWRCFEFGQLDAGGFFSDFGCGINVGGAENFAYVGVSGLARIGFKFSSVPVALSFDWTPTFGPDILYGQGFSDVGFHAYGLANLGITCTYSF